MYCVAAPQTNYLLELAHEDHQRHQVLSTRVEDAVSPPPSHDVDEASSGELHEAEDQGVNGDLLSVENVTGQPAGKLAIYPHDHHVRC
jgi:hypothetical protein